MKEIKLTKGFIALVDDEDFERVNQIKWQTQINKSNIYAMNRIKREDKTIKRYLHRFILKLENTPRGTDVDHINHNGLDNRKENLRTCTQSQNNMNSIPQKNKKSIYKGVYFNRLNNKFITRIYINRKCVYHAFFSSENEAAKAYDIAAKKYYGEFAYLNFHNQLISNQSI